jgi:hypothetical protein
MNAAWQERLNQNGLKYYAHVSTGLFRRRCKPSCVCLLFRAAPYVRLKTESNVGAMQSTCPPPTRHPSLSALDEDPKQAHKSYLCSSLDSMISLNSEEECLNVTVHPVSCDDSSSSSSSSSSNDRHEDEAFDEMISIEDDLFSFPEDDDHWSYGSMWSMLKCMYESSWQHLYKIHHNMRYHRSSNEFLIFLVAPSTHFVSLLDSKSSTLSLERIIFFMCRAFERNLGKSL